ncbi:T9SS type A sorting domain-containing protein [Marinoscillum sp.]|uniref:T9SS type A sorting domain-containing protein n=1 Tax=Marinoscillum sp. TaxID=2024838 RepID=UPI003BAAD6BB
MRKLVYIIPLFAAIIHAHGQDHHVPRMWNEAILHAIRNDYARPTVHARNLFHTSIALYDAYALFDADASTYLLGRRVGDFRSEFDFEYIPKEDIESARNEIASYAIYRLASFRFQNAPGQKKIQTYFDSLMNNFGYPLNRLSIDYTDGSPSSIGNYIASEIIRYGLQDGSNEQNGFKNRHYKPANDPLVVAQPGNPTITSPNRWQPLAFDLYIDQSGNVIPGSIPDFLSPEWGDVMGFSIAPSTGEHRTRDDGEYVVYHDPGSPPRISDTPENDGYQWNFGLVARWSAHLDPADSVMWDISPNTIGNIDQLPQNLQEYKEFYDSAGGDWGKGYDMNPVTNEPYEIQIVPRGDYARVLAEFWADGPDSETPPGHWFTILNYVMDHEAFEPMFQGTKLINDPFEYESKAYFALGAAMHDVAITSWAIKGWYDYIRPVSAIRYMADLGQSSDESLDSYHPAGLKLIEDFCEVVEPGDPLAGLEGENIGKIKIKAWKGPDFITDPETDEAKVGWILAENWWPYQRPTFITPPFAGYVSGHSTYSRAAADILTQLTGSPYFPGGLGEFVAKKNEFLVFEEGPSTDLVLQWASYRDASDQCSLSRIWGGIHPPADDIPGRIIGAEIATEVFDLALKYFSNSAIVNQTGEPETSLYLYPNPVHKGREIHIGGMDNLQLVELFDIFGKEKITPTLINHNTISTDHLSPGVYLIRVNSKAVAKFLVE